MKNERDVALPLATIAEAAAEWAKLQALAVSNTVIHDMLVCAIQPGRTTVEQLPGVDGVAIVRLAAAMDEVQLKVAALAADKSKKTREKLLGIWELDQRYKGWSDAELGEVLGVTKQAVQKERKKLEREVRAIRNRDG